MEDCLEGNHHSREEDFMLGKARAQITQQLVDLFLQPITGKRLSVSAT